MDKLNSSRNLCDILVDNSIVRSRKRTNYYYDYSNIFSVVKLLCLNSFRRSHNIIYKLNLYISVSIFMISFYFTASYKTFAVVDCLKSRYGSFSVISAKPCQNAFGQVGTCMFMWDCIKSEGLHLGTCSDRFLFGSCCYYNTTINDIDVQRPQASSSSSFVSNSKNNNTNSNSNSYANLTSLDLKPQMSSSNLNVIHQSPNNLITTSILQSTSTLSDHLESTLAQKSNSTTSGSFNNSDHSVWKIPSDNRNNTLQSYQPSSSSSYDNNNNLDMQTTTGPTMTLNNNSTSYQEISTLSNNQEHYPVTTTVSTITTAPSTPHSSTIQETTSPLTRPLPSTLKPNLGYSPMVGRPQQQHHHHQQQQQDHSFAINHNPQQQGSPQRPSSWLSPPVVSTLANVLIHSFKPFPYLNPYLNRLRPTYKPFNGGYRPQQHYRPMLPTAGANNNNNNINQQTKPSHSMNNANQQVEMAVSSSETSFLNSYNNNSVVHIPNLNSSSTIISTDNNDHHIVNPSSTMTDRHRPIDKNNQYNGIVIDSINQNSNHYELLNSSSSSTVTNPSNSLQTNISYNHSYMPIIQYEPNHLNQQQSSISNQISNTNVIMTTEQPTTSINYGSNNNNNILITGTSSYPNYDNGKPLSVSLEQTLNDNISYPLLPTQLNPTSSSLYPINQELNEIHHPSSLSAANDPTYIIPSRENQTTISLPEFQRPHHQQQTEYNGEHPSSVSPSSSLDQKPTVETIEISPPPTTTTTTTTQPIIFSTINTVDQTTPILQNSVTVPSTVPTMPPKTNTILNGVDINKKGSYSSKDVTCGVTASYPQTKVVGGKNAAFGAWPWQVSVRKLSFFGFSSTHRCGGAVISSEWIATAGHCVDDLPLHTIRIRVGEHDFSSQAEPFPFIERAARRKVVHPKYNFYTYENDLALVQLDQPIQFPPHVAPICLPPDNIDLLGRNATVTGWGRLNEGGTLPTILQEVRVPIVSNDKCKDMFLSAGRPEYIPDIFLCAGYEEGGRDSCQGDSGGPLQVKGDDGKWFLAGIISWGIGCAEQNLPGVCTRISRFKLWIQSTMNSSS